MRVAVLGDENAVLAFGLAGVSGRICVSRADVEAALAEVPSDVGLVVLTEDVARLAPGVAKIARESTAPRVVVLPRPEVPT